jgi:hypothetical protein
MIDGTATRQNTATETTSDRVYYGSDLPEFDENYFYNSKPRVKVAAKLPQEQPTATLLHPSSSSLELEHADPMDLLNYLEDNIWNESPFKNPQLRMKIKQVAHKRTVEVLTLIKKMIDLASLVYQNVYLNIFKTVIMKQIALKKMDTRMSILAVTTIEDLPQHQPRCKPEEVQVLQDIQSESPHVDPAVKNNITNINAPQQADGSVSVKLYIIPKKRTHLVDTVKNWRQPWSSTKTMAKTNLQICKDQLLHIKTVYICPSKH